jgi:hypothetical protein
MTFHLMYISIQTQLLMFPEHSILSHLPTFGFGGSSCSCWVGQGSWPWTLQPDCTGLSPSTNNYWLCGHGDVPSSLWVNEESNRICLPGLLQRLNENLYIYMCKLLINRLVWKYTYMLLLLILLSSFYFSFFITNFFHYKFFIRIYSLYGWDSYWQFQLVLYYILFSAPVTSHLKQLQEAF